MSSIVTSPESIRAKLACATDPAELIALHLELNALFYSTDMTASLAAAGDALRIARTISDDDRIAACLLAVGDCHREQQQLEQARAHFDEAEALISAMPDVPRFRWKLHVSRAHLHIRKGEYASAVDTLERALAITRAGDNPKDTTDVLTHMAYAYREVSDHRRALALLEEALTITRECHDRPGEAIVLETLGCVSLSMNDKAQALHFHQAAHDIALETGHRLGQAVTMANIAIIRGCLGEAERSLDLNRAAVVLFREMGVPDRVFPVLLSIGGHHNRRGEYDAALECLREAWDMIEGVGTDNSKANCLLCFADVHYNRGDAAAALECLDRTTALPGVRKGIMADILETYSQVHEMLGEMATAFGYYREAIRLRKESADEEAMRALATIEERVQMERAEKEREIYRLKSERLELELAHKNRELASVALDLAQKSEIVRRLEKTMSPFASARGSDAAMLVRELMPQVRELVAGGAQWSIFEQQFQAAHPGFVKALLGRCPALTPTEVRVCTLMRIELANKELADILRSSVRTVENHRRHVRQKLGLGRDANLTTYLAALG